MPSLNNKEFEIRCLFHLVSKILIEKREEKKQSIKEITRNYEYVKSKKKKIKIK
jgi:hypothetical protein